MSARAPLIAVLAVLASSPAHAQPSAPPGDAAATKPSEATCRAYVEDGLATTNYDEARELFHAARLQCANPLSLVYIARTYEQQGDLPRALAYIEQFLAVADPAHPSRPAMEQAAAALRQRVPAAQRVSIAAELAPTSAAPVAAQPTTTPVAADPAATSARSDAVNYETAKTRLIEQVEDVDYRSQPGSGGRSIERARGLFVGANLAYATRATIEVQRDNMNGRVDFPTVFAAEVQAGYRIFPYLSVALAPQMLFNLKPSEEDTAHELGLFVQTTGHLAVKRQWDFNVLVAPGYSVVIIPGADNAKGLAFRWGGGPMFHLTNHISFAAEFSHQIGFQKAERESADVDMRTSFVSLLAGVRLRL